MELPKKDNIISLGADIKGPSSIKPQSSELELATKDLMIRVRRILEGAQNRGVNFGLYPKLALVIVKKELPRRIQKHKIMNQVNMRQLIIYVLTQMDIDVTGNKK